MSGAENRDGASSASPSHGGANSLANKLSSLNVNATEFVPSWLPPSAQGGKEDAGEHRRNDLGFIEIARNYVLVPSSIAFL